MSDSSQHAKEALQGAHKFDLGIIAAGVVALVASMLPFYTFSASAGGFSSSVSASAWHGFFGWFGVLAAVAGSTLVLLHLLGIDAKVPPRLGALVAYAVAVVCIVLALFVVPGGGSFEGEAFGVKADSGHGFGYWLTLLAVLAGLALAWLRKSGEGVTSETPTA